MRNGAKRGGPTARALAPVARLAASVTDGGMTWRTRAYAVVLSLLLLLAAGFWVLAARGIAVAEPETEAGGIPLRWIPVVGAVMLPTVGPMVAGYISFSGKADNPRPVVLPALLFIAGYAAVWLAAALLLAGLQIAIEALSLADGAGARLADPGYRGALLIAIGLYQVSVFKHHALLRCRSPLVFFMGAWREGGPGALVMGLYHGCVCFVSSAGLVLLLFVTGSLSLLWLAMVTSLVLIEKSLGYGQAAAGVAGLLMILAGAGLAAAGFV